MKYCKPVLNIFLAAVTSTLVLGCGTITFFPTEPAQKAADSVIDGIWPSPQPTVSVANVQSGSKNAPPQPAITPAASVSPVPVSRP